MTDREKAIVFMKSRQCGSRIGFNLFSGKFVTDLPDEAFENLDYFRRPTKNQIADMLSGETNALTMWLGQKVRVTNMIRRTKEIMLDVTPRNIKLLTELNNHLENLQDAHYNIGVAIERLRTNWPGEVKEARNA